LKSVILVQQNLAAKKNQNQTTENKLKQKKIFLFLHTISEGNTSIAQLDNAK